MVPSKYEINIAKADGLNWNGTGSKVVAAAVQTAFPAPEYSVTLHQRYECCKPVDGFDWRIEV